MNIQQARHYFPTFPEFRELTFADRDKWEELIAEYPPVSSITFGELISWWAIIGGCKVAQINENIVISYFLFGDEAQSGLCLIGSKDVDESICEIFDWQKEQGKKPKLVHVPEFVLSHVRFPDLYKYSSERENDECILSSANFSTLEKLDSKRRSKIRQFIASIDESKIATESMDLTKPSNQQFLIDLAARWEDKGGFNKIADAETKSFIFAIKHINEIDYKNLCLYINGEIKSFLIFQHTQDPNCVIINYGRFSYDMPNLFEFAVYQYSKWFEDNGTGSLNIESDLGLALLRNIKLSMNPDNFVRKYTIEPK